MPSLLATLYYVVTTSKMPNNFEAIDRATPSCTTETAQGQTPRHRQAAVRLTFFIHPNNVPTAPGGFQHRHSGVWLDYCTITLC